MAHCRHCSHPDSFLQIAVKCQDRDAHRFLREIDGQIRVMRLVRVPFGNKSSPFIRNATIKHHLQNYELNRVTDELNGNLYADNLLSGAERDDEATNMV